MPAKGGFPGRLLQCMILRFPARSVSVCPGPGQANHNPPNEPMSAERLYLLIVASLIVAYSLAPFDFSFSSLEIRSTGSEAAKDPLQVDLLKMVGHFVSFFILGTLFAAAKRVKLKGIDSVYFFCAAIIFCAAIEIAQVFLLSRHARLTDFMVNILGLAGGAWVGGRRRWMESYRVSLKRLPDSCRRRVRGGLFLATATVWMAAGLMPALGALRMDWDKSFPLVVGNESDGSRPWLGEIRYLGIYGRALAAGKLIPSDDDGVGAAGGAGSGKDEGPLVFYDFRESEGDVVLPKGVLGSDALILEGNSGIGAGENMDNGFYGRPSVFLSRGAASDLTRAIQSSGAFSVEAWIRPWDREQTGPARIVSLSEGVWNRNFTLGQEGDALVFRVRNRLNGQNGSKHELRIPNAVRETGQHVVAVYDHGVSSVYVNGRRSGPVADLREPAVHLYLGTGCGGRIAGAVLLILTVAAPGYWIFSFLRQEGLRHSATIATTLCVGFLPYLAGCFIMGGPMRYDFLMWTVVATASLYPVCYVYVYRTGADSSYHRCTEEAAI